MIHYIESNQLMNEVLKSQKLVIVEFYMPNSKPCEIQHEILRKLEKEFENEIEVFKIDITESQESIMIYNISAYPSLIFFKDNSEIERKVGVLDENTISNLIHELK